MAVDQVPTQAGLFLVRSPHDVDGRSEDVFNPDNTNYQRFLKWLAWQEDGEELSATARKLAHMNPAAFAQCLSSLPSGIKHSTPITAAERDEVISHLRLAKRLIDNPQECLSAFDQRRVDILTLLTNFLDLRTQTQVVVFQKVDDFCNDIDSLIGLLVQYSFNPDVVRSLRHIRHDMNNVFHSVVMLADLALLKWRKNDAAGFQTDVSRFSSSADRMVWALQTPIYPFHRQLRWQVVTLDQTSLEDYHVTVLYGQPLAGSLRVDGEIPPLIVDKFLLADILMNLVTNAQKYGKPFLDADGKEYYKLGYDATRGTLYVADAGGTIAAADLARIGEEGYQAASAKGQGTGLGVNAIKSYLARMGGTFELESIPGVGTFAHVGLPRAPRTQTLQAPFLEHHRRINARIAAMPVEDPESLVPLRQQMLAAHNNAVDAVDEFKLNGAAVGIDPHFYLNPIDAVAAEIGIPPESSENPLGQFSNPYPDATELGLASAQTLMGVGPAPMRH